MSHHRSHNNLSLSRYVHERSKMLNEQSHAVSLEPLADQWAFPAKLFCHEIECGADFWQFDPMHYTKRPKGMGLDQVEKREQCNLWLRKLKHPIKALGPAYPGMYR